MGKQRTHQCYPCGSIEPHNGSICLGCGTPVEDCGRPKPPPKRQCPKCYSYRTDENGPGKYRCRECSDVFFVGYSGSQPNAVAEPDAGKVKRGGHHARGAYQKKASQ